MRKVSSRLKRTCGRGKVRSQEFIDPCVRELGEYMSEKTAGSALEIQ